MKLPTIGLLIAGVGLTLSAAGVTLERLTDNSDATDIRHEGTQNAFRQMPAPYDPTPKLVAVPKDVPQGPALKVIAGPADITCPTEDSCVTPDYRNGAWWTRQIHSDGTYGPWMRLTR